MARLARVVIPGMLHHIAQRGNRRQLTFFRDEDYAAYAELMADGCRQGAVFRGHQYSVSGILTGKNARAA